MLYVNVDELAIDMFIKVRSFQVNDLTIYARPLNADDYWILKSSFEDWTSLDLNDLIQTSRGKAVTVILWLGTRRDSLEMQRVNDANSLVALPMHLWTPLLSHIISVEFVTKDSAFFTKTSDDSNDLKNQLKNLDTVRI